MNETPATGAYMVAAYIVVAVEVGVYAFSLWRRARKALRSEPLEL